VTLLKNDILERIVERYRQVFIIFASQKLLTVWSFYGKRYSTKGLFSTSSSCSNARAEFVQNGMERTWMVCAATAGGFFAGCFMRAWKIDKEKMNNEGERGRDRAEETYDIL
jgi:hypothetical protein